MTIASDPGNRGYRRLLASASRQGIVFETLGINREYPGNGTKIHLLCEYLEGLEPDELLLYTDGYDSIVCAPEQAFLDAFETFRHRLVYAAEQNMVIRPQVGIVRWPDLLQANFMALPGLRRIRDFVQLWLNVPYWLRYPTSSDSRYRYLNAGSFMGRAGYALELFRSLPISATSISDQTHIAKWLIRNPESIRLDTSQRLFSCNGGRAGLEADDYSVADDRVRNNITGETPCLLHFPSSLCGFDLLCGQLAVGDPPEVSARRARRYRAQRLKARFVNAIYPDTFIVKLVVLNIAAVLIATVLVVLRFM